MLGQALNMRRRVGGGRRLGELVIEEIAMDIFKRSNEEQVEAGGQPFAELSPRYLRWKVEHGFSPKKNVKTGKMLSLDEIRGESTVIDDLVVMTYGKGEETRQLAEWAHEGSKKRKRPKRPFYDMDAETEKHIDELLDSAVNDLIESLM